MGARVAVAVSVTILLLAGPVASSVSARGADFNGDGRDDLAISSPRENAGGMVDSGAFSVMYRQGGQLGSPADAFLDRSLPAFPGQPGPYETMGWALEAGDFDGNGRDDLAVGIPRTNLLGPNEMTVGCNFADAGGAVLVIYSGKQGLRPNTAELFDENSKGIPGSVEAGDYFGCSLAAGDLTGDGRDELAIGVEGQAVAGKLEAGAVHVLRGSKKGLKAGRAGHKFFTQGTKGVKGSPGPGDAFGQTLAIGNFRGGKRAELAIGAPRDRVSGTPNAGSVTVLASDKKGPTGKGAKIITENKKGLTGAPEGGDGFGYALAAGDVTRGGQDDLVIGAIGDEEAGVSTGTAEVVPGSSKGLQSRRSTQLTQASAGGDEAMESGDEFGRTIAIGKLGGGKADVVIQAAREDVGAFSDAGAVSVFKGAKRIKNKQRDFVIATDVGATPGAFHFFGLDLAVGRYMAGGKETVAIGDHRADVGPSTGAGEVHLVPGKNNALDAPAATTITQDLVGGATVSAGEDFGYGLG